MGDRGPSKLPTKLKLLRGETRSSRLNRQAPKPRGTGPKMPIGMSREAQQVWRRQVKAMALTGVLTVVDTDSLRAYCDAVARYNKAARLLDESGPLVRGARSGELVKNPLHQVVRDNAILVRLFARELGFVPGSREGIHVGEPDDKPRGSFADWEASGS
jgi:P27 family predicted phage terminase small subunit